MNCWPRGSSDPEIKIPIRQTHEQKRKRKEGRKKCPRHINCSYFYLGCGMDTLLYWSLYFSEFSTFYVEEIITVWMWMSAWERVWAFIPIPHICRWDKVHRVWNIYINQTSFYWVPTPKLQTSEALININKYFLNHTLKRNYWKISSEEVPGVPEVPTEKEQYHSNIFTFNLILKNPRYLVLIISQNPGTALEIQKFISSYPIPVLRKDP